MPVVANCAVPPIMETVDGSWNLPFTVLRI
jgi:hypothetical protein